VLVMTGVDKLAEGTPVTVQLADDQSPDKSQAGGKSGGKKK